MYRSTPTRRAGDESRPHEACTIQTMRTLTRLQVVTALVTATSIGTLAGIGGFTFVYAKGGSYLTDDPAACVNCHVMREQFDGWVASSHRSVAVCNDCHAPHQLVPKYVTKAINGWNHSVAFTTGNFPDPIRITPRNLAVTESTCRTCHKDVIEAIDHRRTSQERMSCLRCHSTVGHL